MKDESQFNRQEAYFGKDGQEKIKRTKAVFAGFGGLATPGFQQLCYLGVEDITVIEHEAFSNSNRNRYIGFRPSDVGQPKAPVAVRIAADIDPVIKVTVIHDRLESAAAFEAIKNADVVFGCFDNDGARAILNELCIAYDVTLIDLASEIASDGSACGGRMTIVKDGKGCLQCVGDGLDQDEVRRYLATPEALANEAVSYGVKVEDLLPGTGPSVVSLNGIIASLAITEFIFMVTGLQPPCRAFIYRAHLHQMTKPKKLFEPGCRCCGLYGQRERAGVERYICIT